MQDKIILLDLNYTLAKSISCNYEDFEYDVNKDVYRQKLVKFIQGNRIFLITARTDNYKDATIEKIKKDTGLNIERFYFKPLIQKFLKAHEYKKQVVKSLLAEGFESHNFFGIESNKNTREEYFKLGIKAVTGEEYINLNNQKLNKIGANNE